jgi:GNAT superfamily N-acetyltransferase
MSSNKMLAVLNEVIQRKATNLLNYRVNKLAVKKVIDALPKGSPARKGGNIISKSLFTAGIAHKANMAHLPIAKQIGINTIKHDLDEGYSTLRKLKKLRKNVATNRSTEMRLKFNFGKDGESAFIRKMEATDVKNKFMGSIHFDPDHANAVHIKDTYVHSKMRNKGIGTAMFDKLAYYTQRLKKKFLVTSGEGEIRSPSMISIRERYRTKFIGRYMGKYNEETKVISSKVAKKLVEQADGKYRGSVNAVTDVSKQHVRFIRKNGRIIPIRIKK